jgi:hypothetical protein
VCNRYGLGLEFLGFFFKIINLDSYLKGKGKYVLESRKKYSNDANIHYKRYFKRLTTIKEERCGGIIDWQRSKMKTNNLVGQF